MNDRSRFDDEFTPAEQRLRDHLEVLRTPAPEPPGSLVRRIVSTARWQRAVRNPVMAMGALATAVAEGLRLVFAARKGPS